MELTKTQKTSDQTSEGDTFTSQRQKSHEDFGPNISSFEESFFNPRKNNQLTLQLKAWIEDAIGEELATEDLGQSLHDSIVLCKLMNAIKPGSFSISCYERQPLPTMKMMENIRRFVEHCQSLGVAEQYLFKTIDLYEEMNMDLVVECLYQLKQLFQPKVDRPKTTKKKNTDSSYSFQESAIATDLLIPFLYGATFGMALKCGKQISTYIFSSMQHVPRVFGTFWQSNELNKFF